MSNDVIDMSAFKGARPSAAFAAVRAERESLADGIGSSYPVIAYKGKNWTLRHRGERYLITRPDDGTPANHIDVVILRQARTKSKSYYSKQDGPYDDATSSGARPLCASLDGIVPDSDVTQKQAEACAICPRNEWKTNAKGKKERDCTDYKRLAVLFMPADTKRIMGQELLEPAFLRIPPASLTALAALGEVIETQGYHYSEFVTRISFDNTPYPKFIFRPLKQLTEEEAAVVLEQRNDPVAQRITGENAMAQLARPAQLAHTPAAVQIAKPAGPTPEELAAKAKAEKAAALKAQLAALEADDIVDVPPSNKVEAKVEAKPTLVIDNDTGETTESTAQLDAQIAALMASDD
ncbi:MAG: hypothetical protein NVSMB6_25370 [Burkholderiaceae bacterium]